jgi:hypothetical protein
MKTKKAEDFIVNFFSDKNEKKVTTIKWIIAAALLATIIVANLLR